MIVRSKALLSIGAALLLSTGALAACGDREAESETPVAEAEVSTDLPESAVSDAQLQGAANAAAAEASTITGATTAAVPGTTPVPPQGEDNDRSGAAGTTTKTSPGGAPAR